jgi:periplasmic copper chaperone A
MPDEGNDHFHAVGRGQPLPRQRSKKKVKTRKIIAVAACLALVLPAAAQAHVTVQPTEVPAGSFARLDVRVPNERDDAATERVEVQMPDGFIFVSYEPVEGWTTDIAMERLDQPIESHGEQIREQVDTVTFTAESPDAAIQPGQFRDFGLSVGIPEDAREGDTLSFPAIQTYDSGEVVRWIGDPDSEAPAAQVMVTAGEDEHGAASSAEHEESEPSQETASESDDDDGASMGLAVAALVVGGLGLAAGGASLLGRRRS